MIRHPKTKSGVPSLQAEFNLFLEHGGGRLPRAIDYTSVGSTPVAVIEFIEGIHKDFNALTPEEVEELARAIADIHSVTSDHFSPGAEEKPTARGTRGDYLWAMVRDSVTDRLQAIEDTGFDLSPYAEASSMITAGLERLDRLVAAHPENFSARTFTLLHHDLNPENVIWSKDGSARFIDPCPTYGDPADDINYAITNNDGSPDFQKMLLEAYCRIAQCTISSVVMDAYTLKNRLDDLSWSIEMIQQHPEKQAMYEEMYRMRLLNLRKLLEES